MEVDAPQEQVEQICRVLFLKLADTTLLSRIHDAQSAKTNNNFNLVHGECSSAHGDVESCFVSATRTMFLDIYTTTHNAETSLQAACPRGQDRKYVVLERWKISVESDLGSSVLPPESQQAAVSRFYKRLIVLVRMLYTATRALPLFRVHKLNKQCGEMDGEALQQRGGVPLKFAITDTIGPRSSGVFDGVASKILAFDPIEGGGLRVSVDVRYRSDLRVPSLHDGQGVHNMQQAVIHDYAAPRPRSARSMSQPNLAGLARGPMAQEGAAIGISGAAVNSNYTLGAHALQPQPQPQQHSAPLLSYQPPPQPKSRRATLGDAGLPAHMPRERGNSVGSAGSGGGGVGSGGGRSRVLDMAQAVPIQGNVPAHHPHSAPIPLGDFPHRSRRNSDAHQTQPLSIPLSISPGNAFAPGSLGMGGLAMEQDTPPFGVTPPQSGSYLAYQASPGKFPSLPQVSPFKPSPPSPVFGASPVTSPVLPGTAGLDRDVPFMPLPGAAVPAASASRAMHAPPRPQSRPSRTAMLGKNTSAMVAVLKVGSGSQSQSLMSFRDAKLDSMLGEHRGSMYQPEHEDAFAFAEDDESAVNSEMTVSELVRQCDHAPELRCAHTTVSLAELLSQLESLQASFEPGGGGGGGARGPPNPPPPRSALAAALSGMRP